MQMYACLSNETFFLLLKLFDTETKTDWETNNNDTRMEKQRQNNKAETTMTHDGQRDSAASRQAHEGMRHFKWMKVHCCLMDTNQMEKRRMYSGRWWDACDCSGPTAMPVHLSRSAKEPSFCFNAHAETRKSDPLPSLTKTCWGKQCFKKKKDDLSKSFHFFL